MAIYSLNHRPVGKSTQDRPYTTGAHVTYITREGALGRLDGARLPVDHDGARDFFDRAEDRSRVNGRVADKVMLALPKELNPDERAELVRGYAEDVTGGKAPWLAAHHDKGKDAENPHCHLVFRDQNPETGKRVFGTSERGSTQRLRMMWQDHANRALERAGRSERIDARTLKAQGIDREPQIHEGPRSRAANERGRRPVSRPRHFRNRPGAKVPNRRVDYPSIDRGRTRSEYNRERPTERDYWNELDAHRQSEELDSLRRLHLPLDGRREEPPSRSFGDKLMAFHQHKEAEKAAPEQVRKVSVGLPVQQVLPLKEILAKGNGRSPNRTAPVRSGQESSEDDRER